MSYNPGSWWSVVLNVVNSNFVLIPQQMLSSSIAWHKNTYLKGIKVKTDAGLILAGQHGRSLNSMFKDAKRRLYSELII